MKKYLFVSLFALPLFADFSCDWLQNKLEKKGFTVTNLYSCTLQTALLWDGAGAKAVNKAEGCVALYHDKEGYRRAEAYEEHNLKVSVHLSALDKESNIYSGHQKGKKYLTGHVYYRGKFDPNKKTVNLLEGWVGLPKYSEKSNFSMVCIGL